MKIAYFLDMPKGLGGAGNLLIQQARLMKQSHEVIVVIPCDENGVQNEEYVRRCKAKGLSYKILYYKTSYNFYEIDYINALECKEVIKSFAIRREIDFFHSVQLNLAVEMVARQLNIPHLMNIYQLRKEEFTLAYADLFPHYHLCDSELYAERWSHMLQIRSECVRPVAPLDKIKRKQSFKRKLYKFVILGTVCERKNQLAAIRVVEECLKQYPLILEIAGETRGIYADACKLYVQQHNLNENIHFHGFVKEIQNLLSECDCLLCTSLDESFPSSIVEAVTYDLTIISTPVAGVPEVFQNGYNAYLSKDYTEDSIVDAVKECLNAYEEKTMFSIHENARKTWNRYFSPDVVRNEMNKYYNEIRLDTQVGTKNSVESELKQELCELTSRIRKISDDTKTIAKRGYYYNLLTKTIKGGKAYIWGAGKLGGLAYKLLQVLDLDLEIIAFIDKEKVGEYNNIPIIKPYEIDYSHVDYFFISFYTEKEEVVHFLERQGVQYNREVWLLP